MICKPCAQATDADPMAPHEDCIDVVSNHDYRSCDCQHKPPHGVEREAKAPKDKQSTVRRRPRKRPKAASQQLANATKGADE